MDVEQDSASAAADRSGAAAGTASPRGQALSPKAQQSAELTASPSRPTQLAAVQEEESVDANGTSNGNTSTTQAADATMTEQQPDSALSPGSIAANNEQKQVAATLAGLASNSTTATTASPVGPNPPPLPPGYNKDQPICANCATQTTPLWRRSHDSAHILCNACALFFKMKGRPRPISLKTDVIKSRNRSKSKSTSKDRSSKAKDRSESTPNAHRSVRDSERDGDTEMADASARNSPEVGADQDDGGGGGTRKARKMPPPGYGFMPMPGYPQPYPYPYYGHYAPYPLPAARSLSRSRSSDPNRRAQSVDGRPGVADPRRVPPPPQPPVTAAPYNYTPPAYNPGQPALDVSSYYPPYPYPPGYPQMPYYAGAPGIMPMPPAPTQPGAATASPAGSASGGYSPAHPGLPQSLQRPSSGSAPAARSHSRSRSPKPANSRPNSTRSSPEPSSAAAAAGPSSAISAPYWPHPNPNMHHIPYAHSPLSAAHRMQAIPGPMLRPPGVGRLPGTATPPEIAMAEAAHRAALGYAKPGANGDAAPQSSSHSSSNETVQAASASKGDASITHSALFGGVPAAGPTSHSRRARGTSVSSTSNSVSDRSEDGLRSPESTVQRGEERRGRPERRYDDGQAFDDIDEEAEDGRGGLFEAAQSSAVSETGRRMKGVESGFGDLRVQDQRTASVGSPLGRLHASDTSQSRSRSSGHERGRSRGPPGATRSGSQSRAARGIGHSADNRSSSSGRYSASAEAEIARLKSKVAELTFLNGLMQSRLAQLDKPGSVPKHVVTSMTAETPRPFEEDDSSMPEVGNTAGAVLERQFGAMAQDPAARAEFLDFLRHKQAAATS
ncbi:hypothetical protein ACM66B_002911 [Microbotryomycetes sp. NB124-2]